MAQEIKPQAIPRRPRALWAPLFQSAGGSEPDSEGPGAGGWQQCRKEIGPCRQGEGAGTDQKSVSARESCCRLRRLALFPSAAPERARISFIIYCQLPSVTLLVVLVNHTKCRVCVN